METYNYCYKYPRPSVTTDCVVFGFDDYGLSVLLIQRGAEPYKGCWAFPGGFLNMEEEAAAGALRELKEETGLEPGWVEQFGTFTKVDRDPRGRVITIAYYTLMRMAEAHGGDDAAEARWFRLDELPDLAFDHAGVLREARKALKQKASLYPVGLGLLPDVFGLSALQVLYESVFDVEADGNGIVRQLLRAGIIEPAGNDSSTLYKFNVGKYREAEIGGFCLRF